MSLRALKGVGKPFSFERVGALPKLTGLEYVLILRLTYCTVDASVTVGHRQLVRAVNAYHKDHVGRLLKELHWTPQVPIKRAIQRDEEAIQRWRDEVWPELRRRARRERRALVFEDESGFYLLPGLVRTYAPEGLTPVLRKKQTRDHLSVMGGMTPEGKVYTLVRQKSLNGLHSIEFLMHLGHVVGDRLLVIWDGSPIHRRAEVTEFVSQTRGKVWLEALPGYAPDLNPWDEGGWNHLKNVELRNRVCRDLEELQEEFHLAVSRLRQKPHLVLSFFAQAGLRVESLVTTRSDSKKRPFVRELRSWCALCPRRSLTRQLEYVIILHLMPRGAPVRRARHQSRSWRTGRDQPATR